MHRFFIICLLSQLLGCSALIEHKFTTAKGTSILQPVVLEHLFRKQRFCDSETHHHSEPCLLFGDN